VTATARRGGAPQEIPVAHLVVGDVVQLAAGDMIPGDVRIVQAKDLFVTQGSLTGESFLFPMRRRRAVFTTWALSMSCGGTPSQPQTRDIIYVVTDVMSESDGGITFEYPPDSGDTYQNCNYFCVLEPQVHPDDVQFRLGTQVLSCEGPVPITSQRTGEVVFEDGGTAYRLPAGPIPQGFFSSRSTLWDDGAAVSNTTHR